MVNHFPVVLFFFGTAVLILSLLLANPFWRKSACFILFAAAVSSVPAFLSGEGAEHFLEKLGAPDSLVDPHEKSAKIAFASGVVTGGTAVLTWFLLAAGSRFVRQLSILLGIVSAITAAAYFYTSFQGGRIVHKELRENVSLNAE